MVGKDEIEDEIHLLRRLKHPNLTSLIDYFDTPKNYVLIIELLAGGRLFDHLVVMDNLTEKVAISYVRENTGRRPTLVGSQYRSSGLEGEASDNVETS